jgi:serine/threonine-protein kinase
VNATSLAGGRYELERELGRGGMGTVVLARDTALERPVAVKLLDERAAADEDLRERFLREGRFAAQLSHPNVVAIYDTGEEDGTPYIVMERVDGDSLADVLRRRGPLPADDVVELGRQACAGLAHAHARGLVHRDVKPQNLLLDRDGTLKVADFGIARSAAGSATITQAGTLLGTAAYMAPEVVQGEPATAAADVYSLGAVLYELATARPPRRVATISDLAAPDPVRPPSEHVELPVELEDTIMRCLAQNPAARFATADELARELDGPTLSTRPTEVLRRVDRSRSRRAWLAVPAALAALVAAGVVALRDGEPEPPPPVEPVPVAGTPAGDARGLAEWLRSNARPER